MPTESARQALNILRDGSQFQWYVITLLAFVIYVYAAEVERKNWSLIFAGLAFWGMDWINEIINALIFHFTGYAPVWGAPGNTAYLILVGLNIEICFMFAVGGIVFSKMLPGDKKMKILGVPNRLFFGVINAAFCLVVEIILNSFGALTWEYPWWNAGAPWLIFLFGYFHFFIVSYWIFDMESRKKQITAVGIIFSIVILLSVIFGGVLGWI